MALLTKQCIRSLNAVPLYQLLDADGSGMTKYCRCPKCGAEGKKKGSWIGLRVVDNDVSRKHLVKCGSCGVGAGAGAINVFMTLFDMTFPDACQAIANQTGISLEYEPDDRLPANSRRQTDHKDSFCARQLRDSGLTLDDVTASVVVDNRIVSVQTFTSGSLDIFSGRIDDMADEMLIHYYDLNGRRKTCIPLKYKSREVPYTRVRWSNPEAHLDRKRNRPIKYQTIAGAKTELYFPEKIRSKYQQKTHFDNLFIQEGEKKAEKACKHGIDSIAIQGIGNIGRKDEGLPDEIQYLVQACAVKNIIFLMDADWNNLKSGIKDDERVDIRPRDFARALIKFRKYVATLAMCGIHVDIWFAHVNDNEAGDKGIDDLLVNTLKNRETDILADISSAMLAHDGHGEFIDCINVTSYSDTKLLQLWKLNNAEDFFDVHREELLKLKSFKFGDVFYKVTDDKISRADEFGTGSEFWSVTFDDKDRKKVDIDLINMLSFLTANGFRSRKLDDGKRGFVKIDHGIIEPRDEFDLRNFVLAYVYKATKDHTVHLVFAESISSKLSTANLCQLELLVTNAGKPTMDAQRFYFLDYQVAITHAGIEVSPLKGPVWEINLIKRPFTRERIFSSFTFEDGEFSFSLTDAGRECEFLTFLLHTSDFWKGQTKSPTQIREHALHVTNKITCLGYLLRDFRSPTESRAVVAMDSTMSKVGESNGRSGKSFIGQAISKFVAQAEIDGPGLSNDDQYMFSGVTRQTKNIFIDDINENFKIDKFKQRITGSLNVNIKQGARFVIDFSEAPKFYITTNHALSNLDDSALARLIFMSFSDWYNRAYAPYQEFGHYFFVEWDDRQWQLFDNLLCECVMIYMRSLEYGWTLKGTGAVPPPMENLEKRTLRQEMGEFFLSWAEAYFAPDAGHLNTRIIRKDMFADYLAEYNTKASMLTAQSFRNKLIAYCRFTGMHLNAHRKNDRGIYFAEFFSKCPGKSFIGGRDLSKSIEFYTVTTSDFLINQNQYAPDSQPL